MRAGTLLLLIVLIIMGFGFLLSNNIFLGRDLKAAQQQLAEITNGKRIIEDQLNQARAELANLKHQYGLLAQEKLMLEAQIKQMQAKYSLVNEQNVQLQAQVDRINRLILLVTHLTNLSPNGLMFALIVPLLPIALAGSSLIYRNGKSHRQPSSRKAGKSDQ